MYSILEHTLSSSPPPPSLSSARATLLKELEYSYNRESLQKAGGARRSLAVSLSSSSTATGMGPGAMKLSSSASLSLVGGFGAQPLGSTALSPQEIELRVKAEGSLANEVGLTVLEMMEVFSTFFKVPAFNVVGFFVVILLHSFYY